MRIEHMVERDKVYWVFTDVYPPRTQSLATQRYEFGITRSVPKDQFWLTLEDHLEMVEAMITHRNAIRSRVV